MPVLETLLEKKLEQPEAKISSEPYVVQTADIDEVTGRKIAREALVMGAGQAAIKVGIALAALGTIAYAAIWAFNQITRPINKEQPTYQVDSKAPSSTPIRVVDPKDQQQQAGGAITGDAGASQKPAVAARISSTKIKHRKTSSHGKYKNGKVMRVSNGSNSLSRVRWTGDQPRGGRITYQDGNITEYSWH